MCKRSDSVIGLLELGRSLTTIPSPFPGVRLLVSTRPHDGNTLNIVRSLQGILFVSSRWPIELQVRYEYHSKPMSINILTWNLNGSEFILRLLLVCCRFVVSGISIRPCQIRRQFAPSNYTAIIAPSTIISNVALD